MRKDYGRVLLYLGIVIGILLFMKYVLIYILPLLIAIMVVVPVHQFCIKKKICKRNGKSFLSGGLLLIIVSVIVIAIIGIIFFIIAKAQDLISMIPDIRKEWQQLLTDFCSKIEVEFGIKDGILQQWLSVRLSDAFGILVSESSTWINKTFGYLISMGKLISVLAISFISVILFAREIDDWQQGMLTAATIEPAIDRLLSVIIRLGKKIGKMLKAYIKTQGIIFACISLVATLGIVISGLSSNWELGIIAGLLDVFPFIGTGVVMLPLCLWHFLRGNAFGAIVIIITYILCIFIRELLEPRLLGNGIRFSPVAILLAIYAGILFYGIAGVLLGPITLLIITEIAKEIFMQA